MKDYQTSVVRVRGALTASVRDWLAVERPLQILARAGGDVHTVATAMRTPGEDRALAAGFLFGERVVREAIQIRSIETPDEDTVLLDLAPEVEAALVATRRPAVTSGACGVCGWASVNELLTVPLVADAVLSTRRPPRISARVVHALPSALRAAQATFARTGELHAAGLFTPDGIARAVHEDVGRHNAVDKLVGTLLLDGREPEPDAVLVVSGRASFELVQKAAVARIPTMVAVGAPSSLAVEIARGSGMTLIGFVRDGGFNVYCGAERIDGIVATANEDVDGQCA